MMTLAHAICDRALAPGAAPEWVHLFPDGQMTGRDGRAFDMADPAALGLAFQSAGIDLPVDYEHQNDRPEARLSGPVPAAGWIKELKMDAGGLWARVEWTAITRDLISNREYRFISPSFNCHPKTRAISQADCAIGPWPWPWPCASPTRRLSTVSLKNPVRSSQLSAAPPIPMCARPMPPHSKTGLWHRQSAFSLA